MLHVYYNINLLHIENGFFSKVLHYWEDWTFVEPIYNCHFLCDFNQSIGEINAVQIKYGNWLQCDTIIIIFNCIYYSQLHCTCAVINFAKETVNSNNLLAVTMCPAPGQITVILCVRRAATSQPGRIVANLFVRRPEK